MLRPGDADYVRVHRLVRKVRGPARQHQCVRCPRQAHVWAQVHTETGYDPWADYVPMCRSCHCVYDRVNIGRVQSDETRGKIRAAVSGRVMSAEQRRAISARMRGVPKTSEHRARIAAGRTGKKHTAQTRARLSEIAKTVQVDRHRDSRGRYKGDDRDNPG